MEKSKKKRITHIGSEFKEKGKDSCPDILESIIKEMNSSIQTKHNDISGERDAQKTDTENKKQKNNDSFKCIKKFTTSTKKFPLMEKCQKTFKHVKHNRSGPKPRAHLSAVLDSPEEEISNSPKPIQTKKKQIKNIKTKKVNSKRLIDNNLDSNFSEHVHTSVEKTKNSATITKKASTSKAKKTPVILKKNLTNYNSENVAGNKQAKIQSPFIKENLNLGASTSIKNDTPESSDSDDFENFIKQYKSSKNKSKRKGNSKFGGKGNANKKSSKKTKRVVLEDSSDENDTGSSKFGGKRNANKKSSKKAKRDVFEDSSDENDTINSSKSSSDNAADPITKFTKSSSKKKIEMPKQVSFDDKLDQNMNESNTLDTVNPISILPVLNCKSSKSFNMKLISDETSKESESNLNICQKDPKTILNEGKTCASIFYSLRSKNSTIQPKTTYKSNKWTSLKSTCPDVNETNFLKENNKTDNEVVSMRTVTSPIIFNYESNINEAKMVSENNLPSNSIINHDNINNKDTISLLKKDSIYSIEKDCTKLGEISRTMGKNTESTADDKLKDSEESEIEIIDVIPPLNNNMGQTSSESKRAEAIKSEIKQNENFIKCKNTNIAPCLVEQGVENHDPVYTTGICEDENVIHTAGNDMKDTDDVMILENSIQNVKQEKQDDEIIFECEKIVSKTNLIEPKIEGLKNKRKIDSSSQLEIKNEYKKIPKIVNDTIRPYVDSEMTLLSDPILSDLAKNAYTVKPFKEMDLLSSIEFYKKEVGVYKSITTTAMNVGTGLKMVESHQVAKLKEIREHIQKLTETAPINDQILCNEIMKKKPENSIIQHTYNSASASSSSDHYQKSAEIIPSIKVEPNIELLEINQLLKTEPDAKILEEHAVKVEPTDVVNNVLPDSSVILSNAFVKDEFQDNSENIKPELLVLGKKCVFCGKDAASACQRCAKVFFCSNKCGRQYWNDGHKNECGK